MTTPLRIVFMGTPDFAVPALKELISSQHNVVGVFSQPPRPAGRGMKMQKTPVHNIAEEHNIPVFTPEKIDNEAFASLTNLKPDLIIVAAYGLILRRRVLELAPCINIHPSALPRWRGAAPLQWTIIAGDKTTDICIMEMVKALDAGAVYKRKTIDIANDETAGTLHDKTAQIGAELLLEVLNNWDNYKNKAIPQSEDGLTYAPKIEKHDRKIDFSKKSSEIIGYIRGLSPFPAATTVLNGENYKILFAESAQGNGTSGEVIVSNSTDGLVVACGEGAMRLSRLQKQGKAIMADVDLLRGSSIPEGSRFE